MRNAEGRLRGSLVKIDHQVARRTLEKVVDTQAIPAAFALLAAAVMLWQTSRFYFFSDDFLNFVIARSMGLTGEYLDRDVFGQFIPLYRLANLAYWHCFGLQFWPFRTMVVLFDTAMIAIVWRIGTMRHASPAVTIPSLAMLALSPIFATTHQWWSAALSVLASALAVSLAIALASGNSPLNAARKLAIAGLYAAGLMLYPKVLFAFVLLLAVRVFLHAEDQRQKLHRALTRGLDDLWPVAVLIPIYLVIVTVGDYSSGTVRPSLHTAAAFVFRAWNRGFLPGVLGLDAASWLNRALANVLLLIVVGLPVFIRPRTAILWIGFAVYFLLSMGTIAWNRAVPFGLESAEIGRYYADMLCFFLLFTALAYGRPLAADRSVAAWWPFRTLAGVAVVTAGLSCHLVQAAGRVPHLWYAGAQVPGDFVEHVRASLARNGRGVAVDDAVVPTAIMPGWMWPLNEYRYFLPLLGWHGKVVSHGAAAMAFTQSGDLVTR